MLETIKNQNMEIWKDIVGYEGTYLVSDKGNVRRVGKHKNRVPGGSGYRLVAICKNGKTKSFKIARLVAIAFIDNPDNKRIVNHKDGNKKNDHLDNLEWASDEENIRHYFDILGKKNGRYGVNFVPKSGKWRVSVDRGRKVYSLGVYKTEHEAVSVLEKFNSGNRSVVKIGKGVRKGTYKYPEELIIKAIKLASETTLKQASNKFGISIGTIIKRKRLLKVETI